MKSKKIPDIIYGLIFMFVGLYFFIKATSFPEDYIMKIGPDFYPKILSGSMIVLSVALIVSTVLGKSSSGFIPINLKDKQFQKLVASCGLAVLYTLLLKTAGFLPITILFIFVFMLLLGKRQILSLTLVPIATTFGVWLIFEKLLTVSLPVGLMSVLGF